MLKRIQTLLMLMILLTGVAVVNALDVEVVEVQPVITLERQACFGMCPIYSVQVYADGRVVYNGENHVEVTGEQTAQIEPEQVELMLNTIETLGFFEWDEAYDTMYVTDMPSVITSATLNGTTHRINRYGGDNTAPIALAYLEYWIDLMTHTATWTGVSPDFTYISPIGHEPLVTFERTPCFGRCPTYSVALFEDGTVIYLGLANVNQLGIRVLEVEPDTIARIVQAAEGYGYFEWADAYDGFFITDQATIITSIRNETQHKRITRYTGDPTAPVGLMWVENSIDALLGDLAVTWWNE